MSCASSLPRRPRPGRATATRREYGPTARKRGYTSPYDELLPEPHIEGDEYLNLNIWTPSRTGSLPVLVWIHGGAFVNGSGAVSLYNGSAFARDGVVCVTINYRLGVEGFLDPGGGRDQSRVARPNRGAASGCATTSPASVATRPG